MRCPRCGAENKDGKSFCYLCFYKFGTDRELSGAKKPGLENKAKNKEEIKKDRVSEFLSELLLAPPRKETRQPLIVPIIPVVINLAFVSIIVTAGVGGYYLGLKMSQGTSERVQGEVGGGQSTTEKEPGSITVPGGTQLAPSPTSSAVEESVERACLTNLKTISSGIEIFYANNKRYPSSLEELKERGYINVEIKCPSNGASYNYAPSIGKISCPNGHTL